MGSDDFDATQMELYDPAIGSFSKFGPVINPKADPLTFPFQSPVDFLPNGTILIESGLTHGVLSADSRLFSTLDPASGIATPIASTFSPGEIAVLKNGNALLAGGDVPNHFAISSALTLWNHNTGQWSSLGNSANAGSLALVATSDGGAVLAGGGFGPDDDEVSLFDPVSATTSIIGHMTYRRGNEAAVLLADGRVMVLGSASSFASDNDTGELIDPASHLIIPAGRMTTPRSGGVALLLKDHRVMIAGSGLSTIDLYNPETNEFSPGGTLPSSIDSTGNPALVQLNDGRVLIISGGRVLSAVLYTPPPPAIPPTGLTLEFLPKGIGFTGFLGTNPNAVRLTATAQGDFTGTITFSCPGPPLGITCSFSPASASLDSSTRWAYSTLTVTAAPGFTAGLQRASLLHLQNPALWIFSGLLAVLVLSISRCRLATGVLAVVLVGVMVACGGGGNMTPVPPAVTPAPPPTVTDTPDHLTVRIISGTVFRDVSVPLTGAQ